MARNIEFQGKDRITGEWVVGNLIFANSAYKHHDLQYHDSAYIEQQTPTGMLIRHLVLPQTVGQFTNVIGSDNKKIFDHDIITDGVIEGEVYWDYCYNGWRIAVVNDKNDIYGLEFDNTFKVVDHKYNRLVTV